MLTGKPFIIIIICNKRPWGQQGANRLSNAQSFVMSNPHTDVIISLLNSQRVPFIRCGEALSSAKSGVRVTIFIPLPLLAPRLVCEFVFCLVVHASKNSSTTGTAALHAMSCRTQFHTVLLTTYCP